MTVGKLKEWLKGLSDEKELPLPGGLPDELGDLKNAVNVDALADWFTVGAGLTMPYPDAGNLCVTGIIATETPNVSLWFFTDDESDPAPDGAEITGVQIALSLKNHPVLSVLGGIGLQDLQLVYEIRMLDGAAVRKLSAQAEVPVQDGESIVIACALDFEAGQKSFEFTVEPESGKEWHVAEAFFGLFGAAPPPVLKGITLQRLMLAYDQGGTFQVEVDAGFPLGDITADLDVNVTLTKRSDGQGYDGDYAGRLLLDVPEQGGDVRTLTFAVHDAQHAEFSASCEDSKGVTLADLAGLLGVTDASAAEVLAKLGTVTGLTVGYSAARRSVVFAAKDKSGGSLVVVSDEPREGTRAWAVRVGVGLDARLSQVPLLQGQIPEDQDVGVRGLGVLIASQDLPADRVTELNNALAASDGTLPLLPADGLGKGMAFTVDVTLPGRSGTTPLVVRGGGRSEKTPAPARPRAITQDGDPVGEVSTGLPLVAWVSVQRSVGPLSLRRVGAGFADGTVWVLFDASLGMAGLTVGVDGLGLGIQLSDPVPPQFRLDGLSVGYSRPPLTIKGALVNRPADDTYKTLIEGVLAVTAEEFGLTALGAYAQTRANPDQPSLFLFGRASGKFGGPPPVEITGIMAGFGLNTDLRLPEGDQVLEFPFLKDMTSTGPDADPLEVLNGLMGGEDAWVRPRAGQLWFAAGLAFNIFEFLDGQALLVLEVGDDFAVAVLGTAEARFPKEGPTQYARVRLGLSAKYRASEQILKLTAQLAPGSFLIDEACVLTGGFALYTWFDDAHAGDFVLTLGGYYPGYPVPTRYPQVPRLGFNWPVTSELTISGGSYFALTPGAIMAGGALDVNFRSGDLHAWLTAHANMLIEWAPFHFEAEVDISIGVSFVLDLWLVRETIRVEVGASLRLWGPPTAGEVTVHLWFISFTIGFGDRSARDVPAATWADVVKQLPAKENAVRLVPMDGLTPVRAKDEQGNELWVVGPGAFSFAVRTAVPVTTLFFGDDKSHKVDGQKVDIRPLQGDGKDLDSTLTVTLAKKGEKEQDLSAWYAGGSARNLARLPAALWSEYDGKLKPDSAQRVDNQLMGVDLRLPPPTQGGTPGPVKAGSIAHDDRKPDGALPLKKPTAVAQAEIAGPVTLELAAEAGPLRESRANVAGITGGMTGTLVDQSRDRLFAAMEYLGVSPVTNERLTADDALVAGDITAQPADTVPGTPTASERLYVLGAGKTVTPVDAQSLTAYEPFTLRYQDPSHFAVSPDGTRLCAANPDTQHVDSFDISANPPGAATDLTADPPVWLAKNARGVAFSPDSKQAYATFAQPDQLAVLDLWDGPPKRLQEFGVQTASGTESAPGQVVPAAPWDAGHQTLYIALPDDGTVLKLDLLRINDPTARIYLPAGPAPNRLAVDPRGRWLYVLNAGRSTVTVVDVSAGTVATTLRTGTGPSALAASADGNRLYVANATTGTVSVFDTSGAMPQEADEPVWVGPQPIALAVSSTGDRLYVVRSKTREVQVVDVASTPPALLPGTVLLTDDPVALAVTVPPPATAAPAAPRDTRITEGGAA
ncbi:YncE family protein [Streptomyces blastmyceticus]|uniref:DUF6603 domain-containing protein n=1 Tax=Streptomyces blastmyceticus TaxID=68180 RepID=A0ABN0WXK6_9ACTN